MGTAWSSYAPLMVRILDVSNVRTLEVPLIDDSMALERA
jgi:hypothetical protein